MTDPGRLLPLRAVSVGNAGLEPLGQCRTEPVPLLPYKVWDTEPALNGQTLPGAWRSTCGQQEWH